MICIVLGTRPEIIKFSPIIRELLNKKINFFIIHTNQHYDENMDSVFFRELMLPNPKYNLNIGSASHAQQTGTMMQKIEPILIKEQPTYVIVQGDTNSTLAGALTASKLNIKLVHIEAGLRSYDNTMPEEKNRILVDHISDYLFCPTRIQAQILLKEGIAENKVIVSGNTISDAVNCNLELAYKNSEILNTLNLSNNFALLTLHRPSNVDDPTKLSQLLSSIDRISQEYSLEIVFPIHPRTLNIIAKYHITIPTSIKVIEPTKYLDTLILISKSKIVYTDSGGIQEESCILKTPCITLRDNTERPETIEVGASILSNHEYDNLKKASEKLIYSDRDWMNPFGEKVTERIINMLK